MRLFLFFLMSVSCFPASAAEKAELTIYISDSRGNQPFVYLSEINVLKDGAEFKLLKPGYSNKQVLPDLDPGTYAVVYNSIFGKEVRSEVVITRPGKYTVSAYVNYMDYTKEINQSLLDRLKENDSFSIIIFSHGCFHYDRDTIVVMRNQSDYTIHWGKDRKVLTKQDLETIRHFEMELQCISGWGCTSKDDYTLQYNGITELNVFDGTCRWNGNDYLHEHLFGKEED